MLYASTEAGLAALLAVAEPLVVVCYADWCPASSMAKPVFERVAANSHPLRFCKVRTDMDPGLASLLGVEVIPSFYLLMEREIVAVLRGAVSEGQLVAWLKEGLASLASRSRL